MSLPARYITHTVLDDNKRKMTLLVQHVLDNDGKSILPVVEAIVIESVEHDFRLDHLAERLGCLDAVNDLLVKAILASL